LSAVGDDAPTHDRNVHHEQRQAGVPVLLQLASDKLARCEEVRLVCRVDSLHLNALPLQPLKVGCQRHEGGINVRSTDWA
jgi:hypothetical protein